MYEQEGIVIKNQQETQLSLGKSAIYFCDCAASVTVEGFGALLDHKSPTVHVGSMGLRYNYYRRTDLAIHAVP